MAANSALSGLTDVSYHVFFDGDNEDVDSRGQKVNGHVILFRANDEHWVALPALQREQVPAKVAAATSVPGHCALPDLQALLQDAACNGIVASISRESFERGPLAAAAEARKDMLRAARKAKPELFASVGDGAVFTPFRFPTKMSDAFHLPWSDINVVTDEQLQSFYEGTTMWETPKRVIGAVIYLEYHYLNRFKQKIMSRGRNLLVIKIIDGAGRQPKRRALAWWMPLTEVRQRYADPAKADTTHPGACVHRVCQLVETYKLNTTVPVHFEVGERPHLISGGFPLHVYDVAPDFHTAWCLESGPQALLEEQREVAQCIATRSPLEPSLEAKKADKRRRKRQNKKARERERVAEKAQITKEAEVAEQKERRQGLVKPNGALRDNTFLDSLFEQMRERKASLAPEKLCVGADLPAPRGCCFSDSSDTDSDG